METRLTMKGYTIVRIWEHDTMTTNLEEAVYNLEVTSDPNAEASVTVVNNQPPTSPSAPPLPKP